MKNVMHNATICAVNLRKFREEYTGLSRPKFAAILGIPPTTLKNYELGYREVGVGALFGILNRYGEDAMLFVIANKPIGQSPEDYQRTVSPKAIPADMEIVNGGFVSKADVAKYKLGDKQASWNTYARRAFHRVA